MEVDRKECLYELMLIYSMMIGEVYVAWYVMLVKHLLLIKTSCWLDFAIQFSKLGHLSYKATTMICDKFYLFYMACLLTWPQLLHFLSQEHSKCFKFLFILTFFSQRIRKTGRHSFRFLNDALFDLTGWKSFWHSFNFN